MKNRLRATSLLLALLVWPPSLRSSDAAGAQPAHEAESRARAHFEAGRALFTLGSYEEALREFTAGYQLSPRPEFLLDMAQSYRKMNALPEARAMYRRYLDALPARDARRARIDQVLRELPADDSPSPALASSPATLPKAAPPPAPALSLAPASGPARTPAPHLRRTLAWTLPLGLVLAAGAGVGIYFGLRSPRALDCSLATQGCLDARGP